jgi:arylsulfatase A-like enzyme
MMTGKYSHLNGFPDNAGSAWFNGEQTTLPKLLKGAGYTTAVVGKWHLNSDPIGFDYWQILQGQGPYYNPPMKTADGIVRHEGYTTDIITDVALDWLKTKRDQNQPFFLMYQHKAPHRQWEPSPKYLGKYKDVTIPEPETLFDDYSGRELPARDQQMSVANHLTDVDLKLKAPLARSPQNPNGLTPEQLDTFTKAYAEENKKFEEAKLEGKAKTQWQYQRFVKDYLRCVDCVDENVGRVLDYLDQTGLAKNTVVIYTSDQGWYLGEHGWYDKRWMYEESFRTPLLIRWPGKTKAGSTSEKLVMNLDFAETILDIAGVAIPAEMQGQSFKAILEGKETPNWRKSVYYHYYEFPQPHHVHPHLGVRTDRYKLIHFYTLPDTWELYDLEKDPHELKSVYKDPAYAATVTELKAELKRLMEQYKDDGTTVVKFENPNPPLPKAKAKAKAKAAIN